MNLNLVFRLLLFHTLVLQTFFKLYVIFSRLITASVVFVFSFYCEESLEKGVILFNSKICACEGPIGVNCSWKPLASADLFLGHYQKYCIPSVARTVFIFESMHMWYHNKDDCHHKIVGKYRNVRFDKIFVCWEQKSNTNSLWICHCVW